MSSFYFCTCGHPATEHEHGGYGRCTGEYLDGPCTCPLFEEDWDR